MDQAALIAELAKPEYAALSDEDRLAALTANTFEVDTPVNLRELIVYLLKKSKWQDIEDASNDVVSPVRNECKAFMVICNNVNFSSLDLTDVVVQAMLLNIKNAGLLTSEDQTNIVAMGKTLTSKAAYYSFHGINLGDVIAART